MFPLLAGCISTNNSSKNSDDTKLDYSDFEELKIEWKDLFLPAKSQYFAYIYSFSCSHCEHIKEDVLDTINTLKDYFYLIEYSEEVPIVTNASETIGKERIEEVGILGTPTLLEISNGFLALNIAGESEITTYLSFLPHTVCT